MLPVRCGPTMLYHAVPRLTWDYDVNSLEIEYMTKCDHYTIAPTYLSFYLISVYCTRHSVEKTNCPQRPPAAFQYIVLPPRQALILSKRLQTAQKESKPLLKTWTINLIGAIILPHSKLPMAQGKITIQRFKRTALLTYLSCGFI